MNNWTCSINAIHGKWNVPSYVRVRLHFALCCRCW
uniref:Uncharacterized protein n=1 Tax=Rhizophora mucronata TaxID=61149 RepID=A0A2P2LC36_RHIMU